MDKVLIFSYFFPPVGGSAVQRIQKFVKYLPQNDWEPIVITIKKIAFGAEDDQLLNEIGPVRIYRTEGITPLRFFQIIGAGKQSAISENSRHLFRNVFPIDSRIGWIPFAVKQGSKICRSESIKAVLATIGPYSAAVAAYLVARKVGLPLVIDYRDLWQGNSELFYLTKALRKYSYRWEESILEYASAVIMNTNSARDEIRKLYPRIEPHKFEVIPNGWDQSDFLDLQPAMNSKISFTYAGSLSGLRSPKYLLKAVREQKLDLEDNVIFRFIGNYNQEIRILLMDDDLSDNVKVEQSLTHREVLAEMLGSTFLMLIVPPDHSRNAIPAKVYEYLACRRPIIILAPPGSEVVELLHKHQAAMVAPYDDPKLIAELLKKAVQLARSGKLETEFPLQKNNYQEFERSYLTKKLAGIMRKVSIDS